MTTTQTRNEYLIERIASGLAFQNPRRAKCFAPDPLALLEALANLLADPAAAKKSIAAERQGARCDRGSKKGTEAG